ncbi:glutamine amidotransferase [Kosmotoga arenicorallina S304]|uniref:Pyridoxal 5'-phosphate synthase subunit PdxT n=1 Tax=Kosmotoga arenicorallina S304 TaxID=1453497 RepID=A0A176K0W1_9BACT|nr:pyridoxal 5'-phosphate synthase glutaminase subunit PdxT [Kosmotoga arenicorallina]OAA30629.1 glutamine amidotransferase [Kosmotoga arenicorallina S304]
MKIGVLGIQGDIQEHLRMIERLGHEVIWVKRPEQLEKISGLIMPGGESTTMIKLMKRFEVWEPLYQMLQNGFPVYGTCAGLVLLAYEIENYPDQDSLKALPVRVERNGYGRQVDSFEVELEIPAIGANSFNAVFIRAPIIVDWDKSVEVLSIYKNAPVLVRYGNILASSFHPELTDDVRIHRYFIDEVIKE